MKIPAFDLKHQYASLKDELLPVLEEVLERGDFILGENVERLEAEIASYTGTAFGIGVANGSDALNLALMACDIGPGDEVIVPTFTFFATAGAVARTGAIPVLVDVDPRTFNVDVDGLEAAITPKTRAVIPVHLYGQAAPMEEVMAIARRHGLRVIEDAAQALGARRNDKPVCSFGDAACISFYPTKNLGAYGDAGMIVTSDPDLAARLRKLRVHGSKRKYHHDVLGYNSRLDELQAAVLRTKLPHLGDWTQRRQTAAERYAKLFFAAGCDGEMLTPLVPPGNLHVYHQYTVQVSERDSLRAFLEGRGIGTAIYYPLPLHLQPVFAELGYRPGDLPNSEKLSRTVLSLPMFPEITPEEQEIVVGAIRAYYDESRGQKEGVE